MSFSPKNYIVDVLHTYITLRLFNAPKQEVPKVINDNFATSNPVFVSLAFFTLNGNIGDGSWEAERERSRPHTSAFTSISSPASSETRHYELVQVLETW
jgi:hypothetical protein